MDVGIQGSAQNVKPGEPEMHQLYSSKRLLWMHPYVELTEASENRLPLISCQRNLKFSVIPSIGTPCTSQKLFYRSVN